MTPPYRLQGCKDISLTGPEDNLTTVTGGFQRNQPEPDSTQHNACLHTLWRVSLAEDRHRPILTLLLLLLVLFLTSQGFAASIFCTCEILAPHFTEGGFKDSPSVAGYVSAQKTHLVVVYDSRER